MFNTLVVFFMIQYSSSYNINSSSIECNITSTNSNITDVNENNIFYIRKYNKDITFEKILDKYNVSDRFLDNVLMLIKNGYIPFKEYSKNGICLELNEKKYEREMLKYSFSNEKKCQIDYTYKLIKKLNIEYIPFEVMKLIIRDINKQTRYEKETRFLSKKYKRRLKDYIRLNYIEYTQTEELDYMENICYIEYDKLDYKIIKNKYNIFIEKEKYNKKQKYYNKCGIIIYAFVFFAYILMLLVG